jgi:hypothetical protein
MTHHFLEDSNTLGFLQNVEGRFLLDQYGNKIALPFPCSECLEPSIYGLEGKWYCGECWQHMFEDGEPVPDAAQPAL